MKRAPSSAALLGKHSVAAVPHGTETSTDPGDAVTRMNPRMLNLIGCLEVLIGCFSRRGDSDEPSNAGHGEGGMGEPYDV